SYGQLCVGNTSSSGFKNGKVVAGRHFIDHPRDRRLGEKVFAAMTSCCSVYVHRERARRTRFAPCDDESLRRKSSTWQSQIDDQEHRFFNGC
ncbi:hypothetical protein ABTH30_20425, partial [Acinetobacter baumannii]